MKTLCMPLLMPALLMITFGSAHSQELCPIIPLPAHAASVRGTFVLDSQTPLVVQAPSFQAPAYFLQKELLRYKGISIAQQPGGRRGVKPAIVLARLVAGKTGESNAISGSYTLAMSDKEVRISATDEAGLFYGIISFLQLVVQSDPGGMEASAGGMTASSGVTPAAGIALQVPCWNIVDKPLYPWRGVMLDESRHFFGKAVVKKILDQMAFYKLNKFHWHLTDEPGWRLVIKRYPLLASKGGIGNTSDSLAPAAYYDQSDIAEIVAYATERHITVIPEIDMPGHASAANRAYPEYSGGGSVKHPEFTFGTGREATYQYLANILKEVNVLFPAKMIHLGGDEVSYGNEKWKTDTAVQQLMKNKGLTSLLQVEQYFVQRMADSIIRLNCMVLGWDEITHASLDPRHTIVFWWRQEKPDQLKDALDKGYSVVMCPRLPFYFDFVQDSLHNSGRKWGKQKQYCPLDAVYNFSLEAYPATLSHRQLVLGVQANLWTETVATEKRADFMLFPRMLALAEAAWTAPAQRDYTRFEQRLKGHLPLLAAAGIYYYDPGEPARTPEPVK